MCSVKEECLWVLSSRIPSDIKTMGQCPVLPLTLTLSTVWHKCNCTKHLLYALFVCLCIKLCIVAVYTDLPFHL
jgi:hypothetical protein